MNASLITLDLPRSPDFQFQLLSQNLPPDRDMTLSHLIGEIYARAPQDARNVLIEALLRPLGLLGLLTVANGIFFKCFIDHGLTSTFFAQVQTHIQVSDVIALADRVQQVNMDVIAAAIQLASLWQPPMD